MKDASLYHMVLRVAAVTLALLLVFDSGLLSPVTKQLSERTQEYLANAVGATATVAPTEVNTITAKLTERERELDSREAALEEREMNIGLSTGGDDDDSDLSTYILSVLLFIVLVLIVLNYALDLARQRRLSYLETHKSR